MKKPKLLLAALILLLGAAAAAGSRPLAGAQHHAENAMPVFKHKGGS